MELLSVNASSTSIEPTDSFSHSDFANSPFGLVIEYGMVPFMVFGIVGNVMVFLTARYMVQTKKKAGYVLLCFMAVSDFTGMTSELVFSLAPLLSPFHQHNTEFLCSLYIVARFASMKTTSLIFVCMSSERVYAAYFPIAYKQKVTIRLMMKIGIGCLVISLLAGSMSILNFTNEGGVCFVSVENANTVLSKYLSFQFIMFLMFPSIFTAIFNVVLIAKMRQRSKANSSGNQKQATSSTSRMLITTSAIFLTSNVLVTIMGVLRKETFWGPNGEQTWLYQFVASLNTLPDIFNTSANFPILFITMKSFRENLKAALGKN